MRSRAAVLPAVLLAAALAVPSAGRAQTLDCSESGQKAFVHSTMNEMYLWYREMPAVSAADFATAEELLEALKYRPLDTSFSYISGRRADEAYYTDSQFVGFGLSMKVTSPGELRVTHVFPDSPASEGGLDRGHVLLEINGRSVAELLESGQLDGAFGPTEPGVTGHVVFRDLAGNEREAAMTKRWVTIPTVMQTRVFDAGGRRVGYVLFRNFVRPSEAALDAAFSQLAAQGASDLVLDLRYNGGGLISIAQHLASLVGGRRTSGQLFTEYVHNDKNTSRNQRVSFTNPSRALSLNRLIVITTRASASASELVVNALRPFMAVVIVGDTTYGKPVGQYSFNFCEKVLHPVSLSLRNARGEGDYFGGFPPDCAAPDDLEHALGDPSEASLAEALTYARTGACSPAAGLAATRAAAPPGPQPHRSTGWQQLVVAY